jgi:hypothetical protein
LNLPGYFYLLVYEGSDSKAFAPTFADWNDLDDGNGMRVHLLAIVIVPGYTVTSWKSLLSS